MDMLTLSHVEKSFGSKQVLSDVTFSVPEHSIFGFIGENGAGKTTTMKLILGLLSADKGLIRVNDTAVCYGNTPTNRFIGYLPDVPEFYSFMTPEEYLCFCGEISGMSKNMRLERAEELLALVGLSSEKRRIQGFSRGMKQRLGIAQALMNRPKLLICDEPTSALDPVGRKEILDILVAAREQTTILFSTHILSDVERICDHIALLHQGKVALQGTIEEIRKLRKSDGFEIELERPEDVSLLQAHFPQGKLSSTDVVQEQDSLAAFSQRSQTRLYFESLTNSQLTDLLTCLTAHEIPFRKMEWMEPTLESLFMEVTGK